MLERTLSAIYNAFMPLIVALESLELFTSLSTQRNSVDKSIRCKFNVIRHEFELGLLDEITWIPSMSNLANPGTNCDIFLIDALRLITETGKLPFCFRSTETRFSHRSLGSSAVDKKTGQYENSDTLA